MVGQSVPSHLFPLRPRSAIVAVRVNGNAAAGQKLSPHFNVRRLHQPDQVVHDDVHTVLVEIAVIPEAEQIQLQRFALHHDLPRHVGNVQGRKVRLSGDRTKAGKLRTVELDEIVPIRMLVRKCFQHLRCIVAGILRILIAQQSNISRFFLASSCHIIHLPVPDPAHRLPQMLLHGRGRYRRHRRAFRRPRSSSMSVHRARPVPVLFLPRLPLST